jgi:hypothetical protein
VRNETEDDRYVSSSATLTIKICFENRFRISRREERRTDINENERLILEFDQLRLLKE